MMARFSRRMSLQQKVERLQRDVDALREFVEDHKHETTGPVVKSTMVP